MNVSDLFQACQLDDAIAAVTSSVKSDPANFDHRWLLAELLCFTPNLERADRQLATLESFEPEETKRAAAMLSSGNFGPEGASQLDEKTQHRLALMQDLQRFRQLIRAEMSRREFFDEGRIPEFADEPGDELRLRLEASVALRSGDSDRVSDRLDQAEALREPVAGTLDDAEFSDLRDADIITASCVELLTANGKYFWLPLTELRSVSFETREGLRDLLWPRVSFEMKNGRTGEGHYPSLYARSCKSEDPQLQLGRAADWEEVGNDYWQGCGGRVLAHDGEYSPMLNIGKIKFSESESR